MEYYQEINQQYAKGQVLPLAYFNLTDVYCFFSQEMEDNHVEMVDFLNLELDGIHDFFLEYLPKLFDSICNDASDGYVLFSEKLLDLGIANNLEVADNIINRMIVLLDDVLSGISVSDKTKLFINVIEEQVVFPMALLSYINL
nr:MAG TPA: hypothetical protein [Caudoviricetes sp.]